MTDGKDWSGKKLVQISWENITIKTVPVTKKCGKEIADPPKPRTIINGVSGTLCPGQFVAIIGASGKSCFLTSTYPNTPCFV